MPSLGEIRGARSLSAAAGMIWDYGARVQAGARASQSAVNKQARWSVRGDRYLRRTPSIPRDQSIQTPRDLNQRVIALIQASAPEVADGYQRHLVPLARRAYRQWPVDSGLSLSMLALEFSVSRTGEEFAASIVNRSPYAWFIRRPRKKSSRQAVLEHVQGKGGERSRRLVAEHAATQERRERKGKRARGHTVSQLIFRPGQRVANRIQRDVADRLSRRVR